MPFRRHLNSAADLVTTREITCAGFIKMALERSAQATPYVESGRALKAATTGLPNVEALLADSTLHPAILTAAGVSDKANKYFEEQDRILAIAEFAEQYLKTAGPLFSEELVYRYMLTRGDTLGGSMRNLVGVYAQERLVRAIVGALVVRNQPFAYLDKDTKKWLSARKDDAFLERRAKGLAWTVGDSPRTLTFNMKVPQIGKTGNNVDLCLLNCHPTDLAPKMKAKTLSNPVTYLALGELKGGNDPAGADEHWKTGFLALKRVRKALGEPAIVFIGGAIASSMSEEIWAGLQDGEFTNAANLTMDNQLASFCSWLVSL
jgi:type II restriction enzyme